MDLLPDFGLKALLPSSKIVLLGSLPRWLDRWLFLPETGLHEPQTDSTEVPLVQSDETPVRMQLADGQMETARLWAYGLPWAEVVFDFRTDKSQAGPMEFLKGTAARFVQADGGSSYGPVFKELNLLHIACMAHIRRDLFEVWSNRQLRRCFRKWGHQKLHENQESPSVSSESSVSG